MTSLVWTWSLLVTFADLKVTVYLYIHWALAGIFVVFAFPELRRMRFSVPAPAGVLAGGVVVAILLAGFASSNPTYALVQACKLAIILLGGLALFASYPVYAHVAVRAFLAGVFVNALLLGVGLVLGVSLAGSEMAPGRWGTPLDYPGSLWRSGILIFVYGTYRAVADRGRRGRYLAVSALSLFLIVADGSRTALVLLTLSVAYVVWLVLWERGTRTALRVVIPVLLMAAFVEAIVAMTVDSSSVVDEGGSGLARFQLFAGALYNMGFEGLSDVDPARFGMVSDAVDAIRRHPVLGSGIGTTLSETDEGPMVVHVTYLQVWADLGVLGLLSFAGLALGWLRYVPRALARIRESTCPSERATYYNALFLLFAFALSGLFHPLSTEWSEWIPFLVPYALLLEVAGRDSARVREPDADAVPAP